MDRNTLHISGIEGGSKQAVWQLARRVPRILRVEFRAEAFIAYRLPSQTQLLGAPPGTIMFDFYPDLADARDLLPEHGDLWDAVREDYWAALLTLAKIPTDT